MNPRRDRTSVPKDCAQDLSCPGSQTSLSCLLPGIPKALSATPLEALRIGDLATQVHVSSLRRLHPYTTGPNPFVFGPALFCPQTRMVLPPPIGSGPTRPAVSLPLAPPSPSLLPRPLPEMAQPPRS